MNTLAVIEAGNRIHEHQVSTAMIAIALFYTLGSVLGPIAMGATVSYVSEHGVMIAVGCWVNATTPRFWLAGISARQCVNYEDKWLT